MDFLTAFINEVRKGEATFTLPGGVFTRVTHGTAEFVFGYKAYGDRLCLEARSTLSIYAIVKDGEIIIMDNYAFDNLRWRQQGYFPGINDATFIDWKLKAVNEAITKDCFEPWYAELPVEDYTLCNSDISTIRQRELGLIVRDSSDKAHWIGTTELIAYLDGEIPDINAYVKEKTLEKHRDSYAKGKSIQAAEKQYVAAGKIADWERKLGEILSRATAEDVKYLNVTFKRNGLTATGKLTPHAVFRGLTNDDYFSACNFNTANEGKRVYCELAAWGPKNELRFKDIEKITYKREILWNCKEACG